RVHARGPHRARRGRGGDDAGAGRRGVLRPRSRAAERRPVVNWLNQIIQGVLLGGYYAILASGLALLFGVMRIINLAHGDLAILGAFLALVLTDHGVDVWVSLAVVLPVMALGGILLYRGILERSLRSGMLVPLLSTFGLAIVIENLLFEKFGADQRS